MSLPFFGSDLDLLSLSSLHSFILKNIFLCLCKKKEKKKVFLWYFFSCSRENKKAESFFSFFLFYRYFFIIAPPLQFGVSVKQLWRKGRDRLFFQKTYTFKKTKHYLFKNLTEPNPPPLPHSLSTYGIKEWKNKWIGVN